MIDERLQEGPGRVWPVQLELGGEQEQGWVQGQVDEQEVRAPGRGRGQQAEVAAALQDR